MKLTPTQVVILIALLAVLSFMTQFAIAKWRYEKKRREAQQAARKEGPPSKPSAN